MNSAQLWLALLMLALSVASYFDRTIFAIAAPGIIKQYGISETQMGIAFSAFQLSYMLLMIPGGRLADRYGPRIVLTGMAAGSGLFTILMSFGGSPGLGSLIGVLPAFVVLRLCFGVFTAPVYPASGRMNANWIPAHYRTLVQGIVNSGAGLGGAISPLLFTVMIKQFGWQPSFRMAGAATLILAAIWFTTVKDRPAGAPQPVAKKAEPANWGALIGDRSLQWLTIGYGAVDYFEYIFFYWLYYYLGEVRKLGPDQTAIYTTMPFIAWVMMMPMGGWFADQAAARFGKKQGWRVAAMGTLFISIVCLVGGINSEDINVAVGLLSLALGFCAISDVVFWTATIEIAGPQVGAACGVMNMGGNVGGLIAPVLTPIVATRYGWMWGLYVGGIVAVIGFVSWFFIDASRKIRQPEPVAVAQ